MTLQWTEPTNALIIHRKSASCATAYAHVQHLAIYHSRLGLSQTLIEATRTFMIITVACLEVQMVRLMTGAPIACRTVLRNKINDFHHILMTICSQVTIDNMYKWLSSRIQTTEMQELFRPAFLSPNVHWVELSWYSSQSYLLSFHPWIHARKRHKI